MALKAIKQTDNQTNKQAEQNKTKQVLLLIIKAVIIIIYIHSTTYTSCQNILKEMEKAHLLHKEEYLMSWGKAHLSQHQRESESSVLPPTSGEIPLLQVPQTETFNQQVTHSQRDQAVTTVWEQQEGRD